MACVSRAGVAVAMPEACRGNVDHSSSGFEAACSGTPHSQVKKRTRKRKYTRTKEAWEACAAKRCAKLTDKYGEPAKCDGDADSVASTYHF